MFDYLLPWDDGTYTIIINDLTPEEAAAVLTDVLHGQEYEPGWIYNPDSMYNL